MKVIIVAAGNRFENYPLLDKQYIEYLLPFYQKRSLEAELIIASDHNFKSELKVNPPKFNKESLGGDGMVLVHSTDVLALHYFALVSPGESAEKRSVWQINDSVDAIMLKESELKAIIGDDDDFFDSKALIKIKQGMYAENYMQMPTHKSFLLMSKLKSAAYAFERFNADVRDELFEQGVFFVNPRTSVIGSDVKIGKGTTILPNCYITGKTEIGKNCVIGPNSNIENSVINNGVNVKNSTLIDSKVDDNTNIGPYAYLRPKSDIGKECKIGDFVEVKNTRIDDGSKVSHLSYIGDGKVGKNVNIGCGTVFVNYDGKNKHLTTVEDDAFIGCNSNLIAPVTVQKGAYVAAGSTITDEVPAENLAIARARQVLKADWTRKE